MCPSMTCCLFDQCYVSEVYPGWCMGLVCIHFLCCMVFHAANMPSSPLLPSREKTETGKFLRCLLCVVGTFLVHPNTKGETLQDHCLMEGTPIKISTLMFPRLYCLPTLVPSPMKPLKQNLRVTFPSPLTFVDFLPACQFRKCIWKTYFSRTLIRTLRTEEMCISLPRKKKTSYWKWTD